MSPPLERDSRYRLSDAFIYLALFFYIHFSSCSAQTVSAMDQSPVSDAAATSTSPPSGSTTSNLPLTSLITTTSTSNTSSDDPLTRAIIPSPFPPGQRVPSAPTLQEERENSLLNVYFLLLALVVIVFAAGWWVVMKRKKEKKARSQNRGQNALARDLQDWSRQNRWGYSGWRGMRSTSRHSAEEGLDERGEAPPPYKPPTPATGAQGTTNHDAHSGGHGSAREESFPGADTLAIPLRTLAPRSRDADPPEYEESFGSASVRSTDRPITATSMS